MIILYLVLVGYPRVSGEELIADVEKSLEIFNAMKQVAVARRCAELIKEMLLVAKKYLQGLRHKQTLDQSLVPEIPAVSETQTFDLDQIWNESTFAALLNQELPGMDKANALANLYDPNVLEDFAFSSDQLGPSTYTELDFSGRSCDESEQTGPIWGVFEPFGSGDELLAGQTEGSNGRGRG
jgi:hypothetical protein